MKAAASTPMPSGIDWGKKPEPWRTIGPRFREQCLAIAKSAQSGSSSSHAAAIRRAAVAKRLGINKKQVPSERA